MSQLLIVGGRVIDPSQNMDRVTNIRVENGKVAAFDSPIGDDVQVIQAEGKIVAPVLIDMHCHLREPGSEDDETIASGTAAALAGGFTTVVCTPDTDPPIDSPAAVEFIRLLAERAGHCHVEVIAAASKNREGKELSEIGQLHRAGAVAVSDTGRPIHNAELMRRALEYCMMFNMPLLNHAEVLELTTGGVMHEGLVSLQLGLSGIPAAAEDVMVGRDIVLCESTGGCVHLQHISTAGSIEIIRRAKTRGVRVTAEATPHHFTLSDECLKSFDSNYKTRPPLRSTEDVQAVIAALADGTLDVIATDHSPHSSEKKMQELDLAPFGIIGLETALPLVISELITPGHLTWSAALAKMTINPAQILRLNRGTLQLGSPADITIIDPAARWTPTRFLSHSSNTPFFSRPLTGRAETVIVDGQIKYRAPAS